MKKVGVIHFSVALFAVLAFGQGYSEEPDWLLNSQNNEQSTIALYSFPGYSIIETISRESADRDKQWKYSVEIAPALSDSHQQALQCVNDPLGASGSIQCGDSNLPPSDPDFSTCNDSCGGPGGCHHACVEVWDFGAFRVVASYGPLGGLLVSVEEDQDGGEEEDDEEDGQ